MQLVISPSNVVRAAIWLIFIPHSTSLSPAASDSLENTPTRFGRRNKCVTISIKEKVAILSLRAVVAINSTMTRISIASRRGAGDDATDREKSQDFALDSPLWSASNYIQNIYSNRNGFIFIFRRCRVGPCPNTTKCKSMTKTLRAKRHEQQRRASRNGKILNFRVSSIFHRNMKWWQHTFGLYLFRCFVFIYFHSSASEAQTANGRNGLVDCKRWRMRTNNHRST